MTNPGLAQQLRERMTERNLSVSIVARRAGLAPTTVRRALSGASLRWDTPWKLSIGVGRPHLRIVR